MSPVLFRLATVGLLAASAPRSEAAAAVLYDASLGTLPSAQGFTYLTDPLFVAKAKQTFANAAATLDTTAVRTDKAGWFSNLPPFAKHPRQPALDAEAGFVFSFVARVGAEAHVSEDRAGFSVIATASNGAAIELGFWTGEIWAQSGPDFHHAEGAALDTTARRVRYDLEIHGGTYRLSADGTALLHGDLRNYASFGAPYTIPEFLFLGDDTTSAQAQAEVTRVSVSPLPRVTASRRDGGLTLSVEAEPGRDITFEASTDLVTWSTLGTAPAIDGIARFDVNADIPARYFRASLR